MLILNSRIFQFNASVITELPAIFTHIRGYAADFNSELPDGMYNRVSETVWKEWADFVIANDLKVVWTLYMTIDRTLDDEIAFVQDLVDYGVEISHFQYGGEFWLAKYALGDLSKKGVVEQVTIQTYLDMLDEWIPAVEAAFPDVKTMLLGCSHEYTESEVTQITNKWESDNRELSSIKKAAFYRPIFNYEVLKYINDNTLDAGITVHYYAGAKPDEQPANGEDAIFEGINWNPFIDQFRKAVPNIDVIVPESGWYRSDNSTLQFDKMGEFYEAGAEAIGDNGIMGLHILQANGGILGWYTLNGITNVGEYFLDYFIENVAPPELGEEAVLVSFWENVYPGFLANLNFSYGTTYSQGLWFSDGSFHFNTARQLRKLQGYRVVNEDLGKPKSYFLNKIS